MFAIEIKFRTGMYHATPWGRNVNEGAIEWPPSPYRLIRGLFDVWKRKCPQLNEGEVTKVLSSLASEAPKYRLPQYCSAHIRSYLSENDFNPLKKQLIFDSFVVVEPSEACVMIWERAELDSTQREVLSELLENLNYLGRSESWVEASLVENKVMTWNSAPVDCMGTLDPNFRYSRVACVKPYDGTSGWLTNLTYGTDLMIKRGDARPPLLTFINYLVPDPEDGLANHGIKRYERANAVLYKLQSDLRPNMTKSLEITNQVHVRLMGINKAMFGEDSISYKFSGKKSDGSPITGHRHVYILPLDMDDDLLLDHLLIMSREPFTEDEMNILDRLTALYQPGGRGDISLVPIEWGAHNRTSVSKSCKTFQSATPFVPSHYYRKGRGPFDEWIAEQLKRECENAGLPAPVRIQPIPFLRKGSRQVKWYEFKRSRRGEQERYGMGFRIEFEKEVQGPFAIGYASHFGLGMFVPE